MRILQIENLVHNSVNIHNSMHFSILSLLRHPTVRFLREIDDFFIFIH